MFVYFERENTIGEGAEREGENPKQFLPCQRGAHMWLNPTNCEIMT